MANRPAAMRVRTREVNRKLAVLFLGSRLLWGKPPCTRQPGMSALSRPWVQSLSGDWVRTCLLPVLQAGSQSGGAAPTLSTAGFPDSTVHENRDWVRAAVRDAGLEFPVALITVSLTPTC